MKKLLFPFFTVLAAVTMIAATYTTSLTYRTCSQIDVAELTDGTRTAKDTIAVDAPTVYGPISVVPANNGPIYKGARLQIPSGTIRTVDSLNAYRQFTPSNDVQDTASSAWVVLSSNVTSTGIMSGFIAIADSCRGKALWIKLISASASTDSAVISDTISVILEK